MDLPSKWPTKLRSIAILAVVAGVLIVFSRQQQGPGQPVSEQFVLRGTTMGTTYSIRFRPDNESPDRSKMQQMIDDELRLVNQQMSTYIKDSEISRFNDSKSIDWFSVSLETAQVVDLSLQISKASLGAFDVTVGPLVELWGFGSLKTKDEVPSDEQIALLKSQLGYKNLSVKFDPPAIRKSTPEIRIDLSAIAKGHGVDRVATLFLKQGISNYFIEIGGEIYCQGTRDDGQPWRVAIEAPLEYQQSIQTVIGLSGAALATSGDYRNFFISENQRFSHTIDPNTGRPVTHQLASASVVADTCALADAVATCLMVLGPQQGLELAETNKWAVLLMQRNNGRVISDCSSVFSQRFPTVCSQLAEANISEEAKADKTKIGE